MSDEYQDPVWKNHPEIIRGYYELLPKNERLCDEVKYILTSKIKGVGTQVAHITSRTKTLSSFCEKISRKSYNDPLQDVRDLAGVRVVFLYMSELEAIQRVIESEFDVIEKQNKTEGNEAEKFGYGALHYLVKMKSSSARYDDLKNLVCEIQVRTILQDAWAIVAHHLSYKQESDVPKKLRRKLNALSGLFETADDQFESLRQARSDYIEKVEEKITSEGKVSLKQPINLDNLIAYMTSKYPDRDRSDTEAISSLLDELNEYGYDRLIEIEEIVDKTFDAVLQMEKDKPPLIRGSRQKTSYVDIGMVRAALSLSNKKYCREKYSEEKYEASKKYKHLIKSE